MINGVNVSYGQGMLHGPTPSHSHHPSHSHWSGAFGTDGAPIPNQDTSDPYGRFGGESRDRPAQTYSSNERGSSIKVDVPAEAKIATHPQGDSAYSAVIMK